MATISRSLLTVLATAVLAVPGAGPAVAQTAAEPPAQTTADAPAPVVPGDITFLFYKVSALRQMAHERGCDAGDENARYDAVRKRLIARYGPSIFSPPKPQKGPAGDCGVVLVYRVNLADLERAAAASATP